MEFLLDGEILPRNIDTMNGFLSQTVRRVWATSLRALSETLDFAIQRGSDTPFSYHSPCDRWTLRKVWRLALVEREELSPVGAHFERRRILQQGRLELAASLTFVVALTHGVLGLLFDSRCCLLILPWVGNHDGLLKWLQGQIKSLGSQRTRIRLLVFV